MSTTIIPSRSGVCLSSAVIIETRQTRPKRSTDDNPINPASLSLSLSLWRTFTEFVFVTEFVFFGSISRGWLTSYCSVPLKKGFHFVVCFFFAGVKQIGFIASSSWMFDGFFVGNWIPLEEDENNFPNLFFVVFFLLFEQATHTHTHTHTTPLEGRGWGV